MNEVQKLATPEEILKQLQSQGCDPSRQRQLKMPNPFWTPERVQFVMNEVQKLATPEEILKQLQSQGCDLGIPTHDILNQLYSQGCTDRELQSVARCLRTNEYNVNGSDSLFQPCFTIRNSDTKYKDLPRDYMYMDLCMADIFWTRKRVECAVSSYEDGLPAVDILARLESQRYSNRLPIAVTLKLLESKGYGDRELQAIEKCIDPIRLRYEKDYPPFFRSSSSCEHFSKCDCTMTRYRSVRGSLDLGKRARLLLRARLDSLFLGGQTKRPDESQTAPDSLGSV